MFREFQIRYFLKPFLFISIFLGAQKAFSDVGDGGPALNLQSVCKDMGDMLQGEADAETQEVTDFQKRIDTYNEKQSKYQKECVNAAKPPSTCDKTRKDLVSQEHDIEFERIQSGDLSDKWLNTANTMRVKGCPNAPVDDNVVNMLNNNISQACRKWQPLFEQQGCT